MSTTADVVILYRKGESLLLDKIIEALKQSKKSHLIAIVETHEGDKFIVLPLVGEWEKKLLNELGGAPLVLIGINYSEVAITIATAAFEPARFAYREPGDNTWEDAAHH